MTNWRHKWDSEYKRMLWRQCRPAKGKWQISGGVCTNGEIEITPADAVEIAALANHLLEVPSWYEFTRKHAKKEEQ